MLQLRSELKFECLCHSLCDASLDTDIACKDPLHTVDETALSHIRKTWGLKEITSKINIQTMYFEQSQRHEHNQNQYRHHISAYDIKGLHNTTRTLSESTADNTMSTEITLERGTAVLTNYAHFEWSIILCVSSQTCQELSETTTSEAGCSSGFIQDIIGGHYPALLGLLMKTEGEHKVKLLLKYLFFLNFKWLNPPPTVRIIQHAHILFTNTHFSSAYDRAT